MPLKYKILGLFVILAGGGIALFLAFPRGASFVFSYRKTCKIVRAEPFSKAFIMQGNQQANKFSIVCEDGSVCRAEDTGFAAVKPGDVIEFRGFPEFKTFEEFGKCDHAQLIRIVKVAPQGNAPAATPAPTPVLSPAPAAPHGNTSPTSAAKGP